MIANKINKTKIKQQFPFPHINNSPHLISVDLLPNLVYECYSPLQQQAMIANKINKTKIKQQFPFPHINNSPHLISVDLLPNLVYECYSIL